MSSMAERYRELAPGAYLTLMSMIEAIALETLVSRGQELAGSLSFDASGVAVWLAAGLMLQNICFIWVTNAQGFMSFRWRPGVEDFLIPFGVGLAQFVMIGWIGPATLPRFLVLMGLCSLSFVFLIRWLFAYENEDMTEFTGALWVPGLYACSVLGGASGLAAAALVWLGVAGPPLMLAALVVANTANLACTVIWLRAWVVCVVPEPEAREQT